MVPGGTGTLSITTVGDLPNGETAYLITNGLQVLVTNPSDKVAILDIEADRAMVWMKGNLGGTFNKMAKPEGTTTREIEFYLASNVELRTQDQKQSPHAPRHEMYYDVSRNVAVASGADLEFNYIPNAIASSGCPTPSTSAPTSCCRSIRTSSRCIAAGIASSRLPSDPGSKIYSPGQRRCRSNASSGTGSASARRPSIPRPGSRSPETRADSASGENVCLKLEGVPVFYLPVRAGRRQRPLGPLQSGRTSRRTRSSAPRCTRPSNVCEPAQPQRRRPRDRGKWNADFDSSASGARRRQRTTSYAGKDLFGLPGKYVRADPKSYRIYDTGTTSSAAAGRLATSTRTCAAGLPGPAQCRTSLTTSPSRAGSRP